jgi:hypothetical protein
MIGGSRADRQCHADDQPSRRQHGAAPREHIRTLWSAAERHAESGSRAHRPETDMYLHTFYPKLIALDL